jgi:hypothetical protein
MPCLQTFRDDDHLKRLCGHRDVLVRTTCIPDGAGRHVFIEGGAQGRTRVIQRRFNVSVPRARVTQKASTLRDRSER